MRLKSDFCGMSCPKPSVRSPKAFSCARLGERLTTVLYAHEPGRNGRANDNSCPSGSSMWKYRSPQEAFRGFSGLNPSSLKRLQIASTSATWKMSRPQPSTGLPCSKLRMADSASPARSDEKRSFSAGEHLHAEHIPIELHRGLHVRDPKRHRRNFLHHDCHDASSLPVTAYLIRARLNFDLIPRKLFLSGGLSEDSASSHLARGDRPRLPP